MKIKRVIKLPDFLGRRLPEGWKLRAIPNTYTWYSVYRDPPDGHREWLGTCTTAGVLQVSEEQWERYREMLAPILKEFEELTGTEVIVEITG